MEDFPLLFLFIVLFAVITRSFTVLLHELGHAIPAIIMTRQPVSIYIGSYGDPKKSLYFRIGLLNVWFRFNPFSWRLGVCIPSAKHISINTQIIYTLTGPLTSFLFAVIFSYLAFAFELHESIKFILIIFLCSSLYDMFINLTPRTTPIMLHNGTLTYNDGYLLKQLFFYKSLPKEYEVAVELYNQHKFAEAATTLNDILNNGFKDKVIYRLIINSLFQAKNYEQAKDLIEEFTNLDELNSDDYASTGFMYSQLNQHCEALECYDKSLQLNHINMYSLNNKGFTLNLLNQFNEAILLFDKAIENDNTLAYSYSNRGLAKVKIGQTDSGLKDINRSFQLDGNDPYGYRNLGIYHLDRNEYSKALELFRKAKELDNTTYMIDDLISEAYQHGEL